MNRQKMSTPTRGGGAAPSRGRGRGGASALLQKANAQLRGQRVAEPEVKDDDDIGAYLSNLNRKTQKEPQWDKFGEESDIDISISSNEGTKEKPNAASKFLKKKPQATEEPQTKSFVKPKASPSTPQKTAAGTKTSTALSKAAQFMSKFSYEKKKETVVLSDSDLDMDLSMDSDVMADVHAMKKETSIKSDEGKRSKMQMKEPPRQVKQPTGSAASQVKSTQSKKSPSPVDRSKTASPKKKETYGFEMSDSSASDAIGKGGSKFVKKKTVEKPESPPPTPARSPGSPKRDMFRLKSSDKYATQVVLDTDEESLADFIGGLSGSTDPGSARTPRGRVSPQLTSSKFLKPKRSPVSPHSPEPAFGAIQEVEESSDHKDNISDDMSIDESFKFNVMGIDALGPVLDLDLDLAETPTPREAKRTTFQIKSPKSKKSKKVSTPRKEKIKEKKGKEQKKRGKENKKSKEASPFFSSMGLHTVDELLNDFDADEMIISEASEVPSEEPEEVRSPTPLRSILSDQTPRSPTPRRVRLSLSEIQEIRSRSPSPDPISTGRYISSKIYTEDFEDEDYSESALSIHTSDSEDSIQTVTESGRSTPSRSRKGSLSRQKSVDDYSDDFTETSAASRWKSYSSRSSSRESATYSDDYTSYVGSTDRSRTPSPEYYRRRPETKSIQIQTSEIPGLWYHWNREGAGRAAMTEPIGLQHVDPTPIASHVVSADALEAMTAYNPTIIALNDMLRFQLQITQQFMETQKRIHRSYISSSIPDHTYTTLADTKKYIAKNKKPTLTFEEALRQVKAEMDLD